MTDPTEDERERKFYASVPRRTHRVMICDEHCGWYWSNGFIEMFDAETSGRESGIARVNDT